MKLNKIRVELDNNEFTAVTKGIKTRNTGSISINSNKEEENSSRNFHEMLSDKDDDFEDESSEDVVEPKRGPTREISLNDLNVSIIVIKIKDDSMCKLKSALKERISALNNKEEQVQKKAKKHENLHDSCKLNNMHLVCLSRIMNEEWR